MALPVFNPDVFVGEISLSRISYNSNDLQLYLDEAVKEVIETQLGNIAFTEIKNNDYQKWNDLINGVDWTDSDDNQRSFYGLKKVIYYYAYFMYVRDHFENSPDSNVNNNFENSTNLGSNQNRLFAIDRLNKSADIYNETILPFIDNYKSIKEVAIDITNPDANTYRFELESIKYLVVGDRFKTDKGIFKVENIIIDSQDPNNERYFVDIVPNKMLIFGFDVEYYPFDTSKYSVMEMDRNF